MTFGTWARECTLRRPEQRCGRIVGSRTRSKQYASKGIRLQPRRSIGERRRNSPGRRNAANSLTASG
ncbi:hypothetical protein C3486_06925 [Streptomyces sp. Ru73]|nr:hypothetical protein C3486_06925 [Streptomyces sp. Ru73]